MLVFNKENGEVVGPELPNEGDPNLLLPALPAAAIEPVPNPLDSNPALAKPLLPKAV